MNATDQPSRKSLLFVHGEKGGLGKSLFARVLVSYLEYLGITVSGGEVSVYDADGEGEGTQLTRTLPQTHPVDLTDPLSGAQILDSLLTSPNQRAAIVDLGARQHREMREWMLAADIGALVQEEQLEITVFWLVGGTVDSSVMLRKYFEDFDEVRLILVRNRFFGEAPAFDQDQVLQALLAEKKVPIVTLPLLAPKIAQIIDAVFAPLHEITRPVAPGRKRFDQVGVTVQRMLSTWLGEVYHGLHEANAFSPKPELVDDDPMVERLAVDLAAEHGVAG